MSRWAYLKTCISQPALCTIIGHAACKVLRYSDLIYFPNLHHTQSRAFHMRSLSMKTHWHVITIGVFHKTPSSFHQFHPLQLRYSSDWPRCLPRPVWFAVSVHGPEVEVVAMQEVSWGQWCHGIPPMRRKLVEAQNRAPNLWSWRKDSRYGCWEKPAPFRTMEQNALHMFSNMLYELNI